MKNTIKMSLGTLSLGLLTLLPLAPAHANGGQNPFGGGPCIPTIDLPQLSLKLPDLIVRKVILSSSPDLAFVLVGNVGNASAKPCKLMAANPTGFGLADVPVLHPKQYVWVRVLLVEGTYKGCHLRTRFGVDCFQDVPELSELNNINMIIDKSTC